MTKKPLLNKKAKTNDAAKAKIEEASVAEAEDEKVLVETSADGKQNKTRAQKIERIDARMNVSPPESQHQAANGFVGWLALTFSIVALSSAGYLVFDNWRTNKSIQNSDAALASLNGTLTVTRESLNNLEQRLNNLGEIQSLEQKLNERARNFESFPGRINNLKGSISSLQGISTGVQNTWLLAAAEYYMQIANTQLQLAGNPHLANLALHFADKHLLQLADPALTEVRRALSNELRAIEVMEKLDIKGIALTLASLASVVDSLPLRQEIDIIDRAISELDPDLSGIDRALVSLKKIVGDIVSVRRANEAILPFAVPDAIYFLRANLALQLQTAKLALLRNEKEIFEQSLGDASAWLTRYYDTESAVVLNALETITEIRNGLFSISPPDISESLRLLRQQIYLSKSAPPTTEPD
jgi:uroporphyrin-3 C-methyltransferase